MEAFFKPGFRVRPRSEPPKRGRPKIKPDEEALSLGEKRLRLSGSKELADLKQDYRLVLRRLEVLEAVNAQNKTPDEKVANILKLHEQDSEEIKQLRDQLTKRRSGTDISNPIQYHLRPFKTI